MLTGDKLWRYVWLFAIPFFVGMSLRPKINDIADGIYNGSGNGA